jgi:hypothetical protein
MTTDDLGSDGDDTPHIPYPTFGPPNVVCATVALPTSTPTLIDVVYNEFMEKAVLDGLKGVRSSYSSTDTRSALGGKSLTTIVAEWVRRKCLCPKEQFEDWKTDLYTVSNV